MTLSGILRVLLLPVFCVVAACALSGYVSYQIGYDKGAVSEIRKSNVAFEKINQGRTEITERWIEEAETWKSRAEGCKLLLEIVAGDYDTYKAEVENGKRCP